MNKKKVLILGQGGREHAIALCLSQSNLYEKIYVAPGNPAIAKIKNVSCLENLHYKKMNELINFSLSHNISWALVSPDHALAEGCVDQFQQKSIAAFGPSQKAAQIESSKIFSKQIMINHQIPTAQPFFMGPYEQAFHFLKAQFPHEGCVIKADGLALGKGVFVCHEQDEAFKALDHLKNHHQILIEEKLTGREVSLFYFCKGKEFVYFDSACDHKRLFDFDQGPNTGGMGAYRYPSDQPLIDLVSKQIVTPILNDLASKHTPFYGVLFVGLILTQDGPKVLEFNARLGDPEAQCLLPIHDPVSLCQILENIAFRDQSPLPAVLMPRKKYSVHVVKVSKGYPHSTMDVGHEIEGIENIDLWPENVYFFGAGINLKDGKWINSGGRVFGVTAVSNDHKEAIEKSYYFLNQIHFKNNFWRKDIGQSLCIE